MHKLEQLLYIMIDHSDKLIQSFLHNHLLSVVVGIVCYGITPEILSIHTESIEKASAQIGGALIGVVLVTIYKTLIEDKFKSWLLKMKNHKF